MKYIYILITVLFLYCHKLADPSRKDRSDTYIEVGTAEHTSSYNRLRCVSQVRRPQQGGAHPTFHLDMASITRAP